MGEHADKESRREGQQQAAPAAHDAAHAHVGRPAHAHAGDAAVKRMAKGGVHDLGTLSHPGAALKGTHKLAPGESLRFSVAMNQIWGLGEVSINPAGAGLTLHKREVHGYQPGVLGSTSLIEYTLTMSAAAHHGSRYTFSAAGNYQVREDHDWAFSFQVVCG
jgi:hypothetical protein